MWRKEKVMGLKVLVILFLLCVSVVGAEGLSYTFAEGKLTGTETTSATGYASVSLQNTSETFFGLTIERLKEGKTPRDYRTALQGVMAAFGSEGDVAAAWTTL
jgi:hypothetical protein